MQDLILEFIDEMSRLGCAPASSVKITADDKWTHFQLMGDPGAKKAGSYILKIDGDFAFGAFLNRREGVTHSWHSKVSKTYTAEEKEEWKERLEAEKKAADAARTIEQSKIGKDAKTLWDGLPTANPDHPYLVRKGISNDLLRQQGDDLIVPLYHESKFMGYQKITPEGDKFFLSRGRIQGCYFAIATLEDDRSRIIICEGMSTGKSIREATALPVIVAFNAGNLIAVAKEIRKKYPEAQIIICADNDQWTLQGKHKPTAINTSQLPGDDSMWSDWRTKGWMVNTGLEKATQAAATIGGAYVIWPDFPENDPKKRTDFNDYVRDMGAENAKTLILTIPDLPDVPVKKEVTAPDIHWKVKAIWKSAETEELKDISYNYALIIEEHPAMQGLFAWDEFHMCVMMVKCPIWERQDKFEVHKLSDQDIRETDYWLQRLRHNLKGSPEKTLAAIYNAAFKNKIHPARDYFDGLVWDKIPRLDNWLITYCSAKEDDKEYVRAVGRTWLIAAVKRIYQPGCKFDHMLILEGRQGEGKSTVLRELATFGRGENAREYFSDTFKIKNCSDTDELMKLNGCMIIELAELSGFNKADRDELTSFVTTVKDTYRAPYGRELQSYPRQFVLAGTYNPVNGIFTDPTGYRRFWPVTVRKIDIDALRRDKEQIWAEAVSRYKLGESLVLSMDLYAKAEIAGSERRVIDDWTQDILDIAKGRRFFEIRDIMKGLNIETRGRTQAESRRIANILKAEGFDRKRRKINGRSVWGWSPPGMEDDDPYLEYQVVEEEEVPFF